ncbi:MAG TPA: hypothetical protein VME20_08930 [Acidimicrobiales bacterium]|nr:hypothetical protein [Acidimicrobiales bacterium]
MTKLPFFGGARLASWLPAIVLSSASPALAAPHPSGTLHLSGYYSGTIVLPAAVDDNPACMWAKGFSALNNNAAVQLSFGAVKLAVNGHRETMPGFQVTFALGKFGYTEPVQDIVRDNPTKATAGITYAPKGDLTGIATGASGSVSTSANGASGSVHAAFARVKDFQVIPGTTTVSGSWNGCSHAPSYATI